MVRFGLLTFSIRSWDERPLDVLGELVGSALGCTFRAGDYRGLPARTAEVLGMRLGMYHWGGHDGRAVCALQADSGLHALFAAEDPAREYDEIDISQAVVDLLNASAAGEWWVAAAEDSIAESDHLQLVESASRDAPHWVTIYLDKELSAAALSAWLQETFDLPASRVAVVPAGSSVRLADEIGAYCEITTTDDEFGMRVSVHFEPDDPHDTESPLFADSTPALARLCSEHLMRAILLDEDLADFVLIDSSGVKRLVELDESALSDRDSFVIVAVGEPLSQG